MISRGYYLIQSVDNESFPPIRSDKLNFSSDMNLYIIYVGMATSAADLKGDWLYIALLYPLEKDKTI